MNAQAKQFIEELRSRGFTVTMMREEGKFAFAKVGTAPKEGEQQRTANIIVESYLGGNGFEVFYQSKTNNIEETIEEIEENLT